MKISASIYSDKQRPLELVIQDLVGHQIDLLHVDCNDSLEVFKDIENIRTWCKTPIDLHIITNDPEKFFPYLKKHPVEYITFQYEDLTGPLNIPSEIQGKKGLAVTTPTNVDVFAEFEYMDFILIMATIPGQSGGVFDQDNFSKIRQFRKRYPSKSIHVDGGVNAEVSFILRNMGVSSSVSGSYLFNEASIGNALMNLTQRDIHSHYCIKDFMTPLTEAPSIKLEGATTKTMLQSVEDGKMGFALVLGEQTELIGLVSSADIRKALLKKIEKPSTITTKDLMNLQPISILGNATVNELLKKIKSCPFPIMYLPVIDENGNAIGIVNFAHLIKGEI
jgi:pentose-5-phosphate-3-epimerase|tara:strand:+ start:4140 stop:5144 length:1005 start_codon:yes stop_codon:yes gene_type:complete